MCAGGQVLYHRGDAHDGAAVQLQSLADRSVLAKVFASSFAGQHDAIWRVQCALQIARDGRQRKDTKEVPICKAHGLLHFELSVAHGFAHDPQSGDRLHLRKIALEPFRNPIVRSAERRGGRTRRLSSHRGTIDILVAGDESLVAQLLSNKQARKDPRRESNRQANDIYGGVEPVARQVA
jgi:hypothetical protein